MDHQAPKGMALYVRSITRSRHGTPKEFAKRCADSGLGWIALGGPWHDTKGDRWINSPTVIKGYAAELAAAGVRPHIWGYPWHDRIERFVDDLGKATNDSIIGWLLDPELGLKQHPAAARALVQLCRQANPYRELGFTSYGLPMGHRTFPFAEFAEPGGYDPTKECDYGSPQLYDTPQARILVGMSDYASLGFDAVVPSFGLYKWAKQDASKPLSGKNRKAVPMQPWELEQHLLHFLDSDVPVEAMIGWAENFANRGLWQVLARWSERLARGACALPAAG